jgi:hypothetical protein
MISKTNEIVVFILLVTCVSLSQCAKEGIPPGGPEDTTPPQVTLVSPEPASTQVNLGSKIEITFSERMLAKVTEESIFISPLPKKPVDFAWRGKKLILVPQEPLQPDRTYVISVGTGAQDLRGNRLSQSYTFAFSTGTRLDSGKIDGEVWTKQRMGLGREMGMAIWAYMLSGSKTGVDPEDEKPDYVTQTDNQGRYALENLSLGKYRLFAVEDLNRDLVWDWEKEAIGVTTGDVELTQQTISKARVDFVLDRKDKGKPSLLRCYGASNNSVKLEFDEELEKQSALNPANFRILTVSAQAPLEIVSVFFQDGDAKKIFVLTERMSPGEDYKLTISGLTDGAGNSLDTASTVCLFQGSEAPDTSGPRIVQILPGDGESNLSFDAKVELLFDEPPEPHSVEAAFSLVDSNGAEVTGKAEWSTPTRFVFSPDSLLSGNMKYQARLLGPRVSDLLGNSSMIDSLYASAFSTADPGNLGSVSGSVQTMDKEQIKPVTLILWPLEETGLSYQITLSRTDSFTFERILPGKYILGGYMDTDEDGKLSVGQPLPFSPLEPFAMRCDTVQVRARWETEGVDLTFH